MTNTKPNQVVNHFYIEYYNLKILVHEHIITKCLFFNNLIHFNKQQNIYFDINNSLNITESVDEFFLSLYNQNEYTKDFIVDILRCIIDIIYEIKTDINTIFCTNNDNLKKNITILIDMLDFFQVERRSLQKFAINNINILCDFLQIQVLQNENQESDDKIIDTIKSLQEIAKNYGGNHNERVQHIANIYLYILKHCEFIKRKEMVITLNVLVKKLKEYNSTFSNSTLITIELTLLFSIVQKLINDLLYSIKFTNISQ